MFKLHWVEISSSVPGGKLQQSADLWFLCSLLSEPMITLGHSVCLITQLCLTLCNSMDCSPPGSSVHGDSPDKNTGVGCHTLHQGIFPTQGSNPGLPHIHKLISRMPWPCSNKDLTLVNSSPILQVVSALGWYLLLVWGKVLALSLLTPLHVTNAILEMPECWGLERARLG